MLFATGSVLACLETREWYYRAAMSGDDWHLKNRNRSGSSESRVCRHPRTYTSFRSPKSSKDSQLPPSLEHDLLGLKAETLAPNARTSTHRGHICALPVQSGSIGDLHRCFTRATAAEEWKERRSVTRRSLNSPWGVSFLPCSLAG